VFTVPARSAFWIAAAASVCFAQTAPPAPAPRAISLPPTGRTGGAGSVSVQQSATPSGAETIGSSVQVGGNLRGSVPGEASGEGTITLTLGRVPGETPPAGTITLTLADAVKRGLATNLGAITAANTNTLAAAQRIQALSALLPNISISAAETETQVNLAAFGFKFNLPPGLGFSIPSVVGPFRYSQAQASLSQAVFDPVARRNYQVTRELERAASLSAKDARELIVLAVAGSYLQTIAIAARIESQRAQVANAQAVYNQAEVRRSAGTNARIDVMRTLVELETQRQRLAALEADHRKQKLALARAIGLPLDRDFTLTEPLSSTAVPVPDAAASIQRAFQSRSDLRAAEAQVSAAERAVAAARAERLPSVTLSGDYGVLGPNPTQAHGVFAVTGSVNMPIFLGGRVKGDIQQAEAVLHQRQAELADQRGQVEQEVRAATIELETALGQVQLAQNNRSYAAETLREATDRFNLGVGTTVEVVQAQEQVASAEADLVSSTLALDLSRLSLSRAIGEAETALPDLLKVSHP
jgi:outer membrane protein TolC